MLNLCESWQRRLLLRSHQDAVVAAVEWPLKLLRLAPGWEALGAMSYVAYPSNRL